VRAIETVRLSTEQPAAFWLDVLTLLAAANGQPSIDRVRWPIVRGSG
jgi:hypothetical protein